MIQVVVAAALVALTASCIPAPVPPPPPPPSLPAPQGSAGGPLGNPYWPDRTVARGLAISSSSAGVVLDGNGKLYGFGAAPSTAGAPYWRSWDIARSVALSPTRGGYVLDGYGGVHRFGGARALPRGPYWLGWDIARGLALAPGGGGYVLDGYGGLHRLGSAPALTGGPYWPGWDIARDVVILPDGTGGYVLDAYGGLHGFGIGGNPAPADSARVGGVYVPSTTKAAWANLSGAPTGQAYYGPNPPSSACAGSKTPLTNPSDPAAGQVNQCLAWYRPDTAKYPGPRPTIVFIHGGGWYAGSAVPVAMPLDRYRAAGWAVVTVQYRFSTCAAGRTPINQFPTPARDVQDAIAYIKAHATEMGVDANRLVLWGHSAGAHLAALAATGWNDTTGHLRTGAQYRPSGWVAIAGMEDLVRVAKNTLGKSLLSGFIPPTRPGVCDGSANTSELRAASAYYQLDSADPPGYMVKGTNDALTPAGPPEREMGAAMAAAGRPTAVWYQAVPRGGHLPAFNPSYMDRFLTQAANWATSGVDPAP